MEKSDACQYSRPGCAVGRVAGGAVSIRPPPWPTPALCCRPRSCSFCPSSRWHHGRCPPSGCGTWRRRGSCSWSGRRPRFDWAALSARPFGHTGSVGARFRRAVGGGFRVSPWLSTRRCAIPSRPRYVTGSPVASAPPVCARSGSLRFSSSRVAPSFPFHSIHPLALYPSSTVAAALGEPKR